MNAACDHVMHEFALKALGFMHVMHVMHTIFVGHVYACMSWMLAKCMYIAMLALCAAHACVFIMHALCVLSTIMYSTTCSCMLQYYMSCMLVFSYAWLVTVGRQDKLSTSV